MVGLLAAGGQQSCLLTELPFDEVTQQPQKSLPVGRR